MLGQLAGPKTLQTLGENPNINNLAWPPRASPFTLTAPPVFCPKFIYGTFSALTLALLNSLFLQVATSAQKSLLGGHCKMSKTEVCTTEVCPEPMREISHKFGEGGIGKGVFEIVRNLHSILRQFCTPFLWCMKRTTPQLCANLACNLRQICAAPPSRTPLSRDFWISGTLSSETLFSCLAQPLKMEHLPARRHIGAVPRALGGEGCVCGCAIVAGPDATILRSPFWHTEQCWLLAWQDGWAGIGNRPPIASGNIPRRRFPH